MTRLTAALTLALATLALSACDMATAPTTPRPAPAPAPTPAAADADALQAPGQSVAALDTTTAAEKAAAAAPAQGGGKLGSSVASLGDATEGGFWVKSPLVKTAGKGRVTNTETGKSANVDLKPLSGSGTGSQLSLAAMQALGAGMTDLPLIEIWQN